MIKEFDEDTIAAISTPPGEGGIGVVRLSGENAISIADKIFESKKKTRVCDQKNFTAQYGHIVSRESTGQTKVIDEVLVLLMRKPKSYTCEDVVEISAHGSGAVLQTILQLAIQAGARLAAKGEFTKRAFLNGRLDLLQAEAVLDLVRAKTPLGAQWAAAQLDGVLSKKMQSVKKELLNVLSHLEASIDFPDDSPETESSLETAARLGKLADFLRELLSSASMGLMAKRGLKIVISGRPNVGKSSLMNQLAKSSRVIVTPYPGTTRDVVEEEIQIQGLPVRVLDTAGIQDTSHPIEKEGIERTKIAVEESDLVLFVLDGSQPWSPEDQNLIDGLQDKKKIVVINKADLPQKLDQKALALGTNGFSIVASSCVTGAGIKALEDEIACFITQGKVLASDEAVITTVRQKDLLEKTLTCVEDARQGCLEGLSPELVAIDVRLGLDCMGRLVGEVLTDDVLELLFSQFCIGK